MILHELNQIPSRNQYTCRPPLPFSLSVITKVHAPCGWSWTKHDFYICAKSLLIYCPYFPIKTILYLVIIIIIYYQDQGALSTIISFFLLNFFNPAFYRIILATVIMITSVLWNLVGLVIHATLFQFYIELFVNYRIKKGVGS